MTRNVLKHKLSVNSNVMDANGRYSSILIYQLSRKYYLEIRQLFSMMSQYWNAKIQLCLVLFDFYDKKSALHLNRRSLFHDEFDAGPFLPI